MITFHVTLGCLFCLHMIAMSVAHRRINPATKLERRSIFLRRCGERDLRFIIVSDRTDLQSGIDPNEGRL